jgi:hypothetical protein
MSRGRARFTESDVARLLRAATKARVSINFEIHPDGRMLVTAGSSFALVAPAAEANPWDTAIAGLTAGSS